jgi:hypothetical protein
MCELGRPIHNSFCSGRSIATANFIARILHGRIQSFESVHLSSGSAFAKCRPDQFPSGLVDVGFKFLNRALKISQADLWFVILVDRWKL